MSENTTKETQMPEKEVAEKDVQQPEAAEQAEAQTKKSGFLKKDKKDKVIRMERSYGSYTRSFDISGVDADKIKAKYVDGVLKLPLPQLEQRLPEGRRLEIEYAHLTEIPPGSNPGRCTYFADQ